MRQARPRRRPGDARAAAIERTGVIRNRRYRARPRRAPRLVAGARRMPFALRHLGPDRAHRVVGNRTAPGRISGHRRPRDPQPGSSGAATPARLPSFESPRRGKFAAAVRWRSSDTGPATASRPGSHPPCPLVLGSRAGLARKAVAASRAIRIPARPARLRRPAGCRSNLCRRARPRRAPRPSACACRTLDPLRYRDPEPGDGRGFPRVRSPARPARPRRCAGVGRVAATEHAAARRGRPLARGGSVRATDHGADLARRTPSSSEIAAVPRPERRSQPPARSVARRGYDSRPRVVRIAATAHAGGESPRPAAGVRRGCRARDGITARISPHRSSGGSKSRLASASAALLN